MAHRDHTCNYLVNAGFQKHHHNHSHSNNNKKSKSKNDNSNTNNNNNNIINNNNNNGNSENNNTNSISNRNNKKYHYKLNNMKITHRHTHTFSQISKPCLCWYFQGSKKQETSKRWMITWNTSLRLRTGLSLSVTRAIFITTGWSHPLFLVVEGKAFLKHFHGPRKTVTLKKLLIVGLCAFEGYKSHNEDLSSRAIYHFPQIVRWVNIWIDLQQVQFFEIRTDYCCS